MPRDGVYKFQNQQKKCLTVSNEKKSALMWHRRLGHLNYYSMCKMRDGAVKGVEFNGNESEIKNCETCAIGKQCRLPFKENKNASNHKLELIHSDLVGPMETQSLGKAKYLLTFIDDFSRKVCCFFLTSKEKVYETFVEFKAYVEKQTGCKIKSFRTDNGTEYVTDRFDKFFKTNGIQHQRNTPYSPQQNGVAERFNRTLIEKARCLLHDADLPKQYWAEAVNMASYLINHSVSTRTVNKTPEEIWTGKKTDLSHLKIFGSQVMVHVPKQKQKKLAVKSVKMIFVGFDGAGFRCIDRRNSKLTRSRDVNFHENLNTRYEDMNSVRDVSEVSSNVDEGEIPMSQINSTKTSEIDVEDTFVDSSEFCEIEDLPTDNGESSERNDDPKKSSIITRSKLNKQLNLIALLTLEPQSVDEALSCLEKANWKEAMDCEIESHRINKTWELVELPKNHKAIKSKWVFKVKKSDNEKTQTFKARLVAKGCSQRYGIDYMETYSPVVRHTSIRFLMALAIKNKYKIHQMDVVTAYLQGDLEEEIYMQQPEKFDDGTNKVCKLKKSLYGLKQAGRQWNKKLDYALQNYGLTKSKADPCIYYKKCDEIIVAIYVDDFLMFYKNENELEKVKNFLNNNFNMKDLGIAKNCLGLRINQTSEFIELDQIQYINEILHRFGMQDCKPVGSPSDTNQKLTIKDVNDNNSLVGKVPYQEAVGSLLYLTQGTRPDIAFAVNNASRFNLNHSAIHWQAVKKIFCYLKGSINLKLRYTYDTKSTNNQVHAYSDADWASDIDKRRSCTGYIIKMANGAINWNSKRQPIVALSRTEEEYIALSSTVREIIWINQLKHELEEKSIGTTTIFCDNQSTIKLSQIDGFRPRTKHIDIQFHHIREKIDDNTIKLEYVSTKQMTADFLTKPVTTQMHLYCTNQAGLMNTDDIQ